MFKILEGGTNKIVTKYLNPHKNGPFGALMQNGQKYGVSLLQKTDEGVHLVLFPPPLPCESKDLLNLGHPITGPPSPPLCRLLELALKSVRMKKKHAGTNG
jgi:hypothetical protein